MRLRFWAALLPVAGILVACGPATEPAAVPPPPPSTQDSQILRQQLSKERTTHEKLENRLRHQLRKARSDDLGVQFARIAVAQRGDWYLWGATGPDRFDCSGLVYYAGQKVGKTLPRTTGSLISYGQPVTKREVGDLVFPHSGHVGIYIGAGRMVHSPHSGAQVQIDTAPPGTTRRVI